jgi:hypothetical protein
MELAAQHKCSKRLHSSGRKKPSITVIKHAIRKKRNEVSRMFQFLVFRSLFRLRTRNMNTPTHKRSMTISFSRIVYLSPSWILTD